MSLILEALRKSEAERQRGRAPGLFVEQVPASRRPRGAPAWAWGLGVLLLVVLAVFAWREWGRSVAPPQATVPAPGASVQAPAQAPASIPPAPAATTATTLPASTPAPATATTLPAATPAPSAAPPPLATTPTVAAPLPATSPAPATVTAPVAAPTPAPAPDPARAPAATSAPAAAPPALAPTPAFAESSEPELPTLSNIDANERAQLPPLRLSMHVYAEEPSQRFVILDGQRLGEGASPAPGLVLEQIRRDGLVLSVNGRRLLLPRP